MNEGPINCGACGTRMRRATLPLYEYVEGYPPEPVVQLIDRRWSSWRTDGGSGGGARASTAAHPSSSASSVAVRGTSYVKPRKCFTGTGEMGVHVLVSKRMV